MIFFSVHFIFLLGCGQGTEHLVDQQVKGRANFFYFGFRKCFNQFNCQFDCLGITIWRQSLRTKVFFQCPADHLEFFQFLLYLGLEFPAVWSPFLFGVPFPVLCIVARVVFFGSSVRLGDMVFVGGFPFAFDFGVSLIGVGGGLLGVGRPAHN